MAQLDADTVPRETILEKNDHTHNSANMIDQLPILEVPPSSLENGFFLRETGTNLAHVRLLAEVASSAELPPILVQQESSRIVDGMHRLEVAKLRGSEYIRARFINCTDEEAFILAIKSNTLHGLPLSRADRIFGAKRILAWHPDWSDRAIGADSGLSAKTIASLRERSDDAAQQVSMRLGRDGKRRPISSTEGRKRAADYITARPDAPLREVAREARVSLGTVQDVRARMLRGADPVVLGRKKAHLEGVPNASAKTGPVDPGSPADSFPVREIRGDAQQASWSAISPKLANDPSLKYSEGGKAFFRWMAQHAVQRGEWKEFIDAIPPHWLKDVSSIAEGMRDEWNEFADLLMRRQNRSA